MSIFLFIIIIFFFIIIFASSIIFSVIRWILSLLGIESRRNYNNSKSTHQNKEETGNRWQNNSQTGTNEEKWHFSPEEQYKRKKRKKIIAPDEGEYVDFEEIRK